MTKSGLPEVDSSAVRPEAELEALLASASRDSRLALRAFFISQRDELERRYRLHLMSDPDISAVVIGDTATEQTIANFIHWVDSITDPELSRIEALVRRQEEVGEQLARIGYPAHAISSSMRKFKQMYIRHLAAENLPRPQMLDAALFAVALVDLSLELRQIGYQRCVASQARINEAYRLHSLGQNLAMERERQRGLLMEWGHKLFSSFHQQQGSDGLPYLWKSDFGLWINHKGRIVFEQETLLESVIDAVDRIDTQLVPALEQASLGDTNTVRKLSRRIEEELSAIKFGLNSLFEKHLEIENGRDPLTQLLTRRFMPAVLMREIKLQKEGGSQGFCVLLVDIDHFKSVNDQYGHESGDVALQQIAGMISTCVRPSDFVFRYGGEEMAVVLVDSALETARQLAERIRKSVEKAPVKLPQGLQLPLTVSVGIAAFTGELDYEAIVRRADRAMYQAKSSGRNQVVTAAA